MSGTGTSKRSLEDSSHGHFPSTAKFPSHEDHINNSGSANTGPSPAFSNLPSSSMPLVIASDYHTTGPAPFESGPDAHRLAKIPRTDSQQQLQRPSPHISMSRIPSSSPGDLHLDLPAVTPENRVELRDPSKGGGRDLKTVESNRDVKSDSREFLIDGKRDSQTALKMEKDVGRFEISRALGDGNKETKYDTEIHTADSKGEVNAASSHSSWKEIKELHRGKRYLESSPSRVVGTMEWHMARRREAADIKPWAYLDSQSHEAVGENKVDSKSDEKFKDKDRKRKDGKPRDWGERDKERSDRRLQLGTSGNEGRDLVREEKEPERWDRERKESMKEKERSKEQKDHTHVKREAWNGAEPDSAQHHEKEVTASSIRKPEQQENLVIEQKKQKDFDFDSWKSADRETRDRRKERDGDVEGDRPERRSRIYEKESDDGCTDVDGGNERERDVFNYGVQQRKRMLRPRYSPQMSNREPRFRSRSQDVDGSHGKPEISIIVYKVGECMQELTKLWSEYESSRPDKNGESSHIGPTLEIRIPAEHVTATNRQVRGAQLWGTDTYTVDSDLVAVLMHTGYCRPTASPPAPAIHELHATIRVLPPQDCYVSTLRNNVRSRAWGAATSCSFRIERCCIVKKGGGTIDLEPCLTYTSTVEPTLAPVAVERTMTTRAAASNALRQQRFVREVTIQYNLCNEPWIKYSISIVADKGLKRPLYTSARLKKGEVLYLETHFHRYELCFTGERMVRAANAAQIHEVDLEKSHNHNLHSANGERNVDGDNTVIDVFRWSHCKKILPQKIMCSIGIPLPLEYLEVLEENLDWEDVQWSQTGVWIAGKEYALARVHFLSPA